MRRAEAFAGGSQDRQQQDGEGVEGDPRHGRRPGAASDASLSAPQIIELCSALLGPLLRFAWRLHVSQKAHGRRP